MGFSVIHLLSLPPPLSPFYLKCFSKLSHINFWDKKERENIHKQRHGMYWGGGIPSQKLCLTAPPPQPSMSRCKDVFSSESWFDLHPKALLWKTRLAIKGRRDKLRCVHGALVSTVGETHFSCMFLHLNKVFQVWTCQRCSRSAETQHLTRIVKKKRSGSVPLLAHHGQKELTKKHTKAKANKPNKQPICYKQSMLSSLPFTCKMLLCGFKCQLIFFVYLSEVEMVTRNTTKNKEES